MKPSRFNALSAAVLAVIGLSSCSTQSGLRKFDDENIKKEIPKEVAEKFEVKDMSGPTPTPAPKPVVVVPKKKKGKVVSVPQEPVSTVLPNRRLETMPFEVGEKLSYDVRFIGVTAATFNMEVLPEKLVNNRKVYHFQGHAKTLKLFELVYRVDDLIESFVDYDGLFSHRFTMNLDESKQSRKLIELYDYEKKKSFMWNRIDHKEKGFSEQKVENDIKLWSQDPLSFMYYVRAANLPQGPSAPVKIPVIIDGKPWETVMTFDRRESISVGNRRFEANVYRVENYLNGELKNKDNTFWISNDAKRYLLRVEAKVKVGSFAVALDRIL
jgi:hypothetical protein